MGQKLTKRLVDGATPSEKYYFIWDAGDGAVKGFGLKVNRNGQKVFVAQFRIGSGRSATLRRTTIGNFGAWTVERAREAAKELIRKGNDGIDEYAAKVEEDELAAAAQASALAEQQRTEALRLDRVIERYMDEHVRLKRKPRTVSLYSFLFGSHIIPSLGTRDSRTITRQDIALLHRNLADKPTTANRCVTVLGAVYSWAIKMEIFPDGIRNPCQLQDKFKEQGRERFLTSDELSRLGETIRRAETDGIEWTPDPTKKVKHAPRPENRKTVIRAEAAAAIRLLILTGARLNEILNLEWRHVDLERGLLFLPDSKTGKKTIILNAPAVAVLMSLPRTSVYVMPGDVIIDADGRTVEKPRVDLKRPWALVTKAAGLEGLRIHDLRHSFASFGAGSGMGLPIIGKLLGHSQSATTARYAHLDNDPLRKASEAIGSIISNAMERTTTAHPG